MFIFSLRGILHSSPNHHPRKYNLFHLSLLLFGRIISLMAETKAKKPRYLTKSRYKLALECPAKLYYTGKPQYADQKVDDEFMQTLAEGGFQVGALAQQYFPNGTEIKAIDYDEAVEETARLLEKENVVIYEGAIRYGDFYIKADIIVKKGNHVDLIEVKAKSIDRNEDKFEGPRVGITSDWKPYLKDIAFQKHVFKKAFPKLEVSAYLMLADKTALCPTDGLNQKFKIVKGANDRKSIKIAKPITKDDLSVEILTKILVDEYCEMIYKKEDVKKKKADKLTESDKLSYEEELAWYADCYKKDKKIEMCPFIACKECEYKATDEDKAKGLKSGFEECWTAELSWKKKDFDEPTVLDIWATKSKQKFMDDGRYKMKQINKDDINPVPDDKGPGLSQSQRIWLQIEKEKGNDTSPYIDKTNLLNAMDKFNFPLHFIDFETACVAIPFMKGKHPYEQIAFQFSHHTVDKDGTVTHKGEYINADPGVFPNYDFARALKGELEKDNGSIFRFADHENTILNKIREQLVADRSKIPDRDEIVAFIESITQNKDDNRAGKRNMIDLRQLVLRYYYDPYTKGSNSIKKVLPAVLNSSKFLRDKYSKPIYGAKDGIPSKNYENKQWLKIEDGKVVDPYEQLPKLHKDLTDAEVEWLFESDELKAGGAAAAAYGKLQFVDMSDEERKELEAALLKYCELDTLAMVMIYECWRELVK